MEVRHRKMKKQKKKKATELRLQAGTIICVVRQEGM